MASLHALGTRADEGFQDERVHRAVLLLAVSGQGDKLVSGDGPGYQDSSVLSSRTSTDVSDSARIADLIEVFPSQNGTPFFLSHSVIVLQGLSTPPRIRTETEPGLSRMLLPVERVERRPSGIRTRTGRLLKTLPLPLGYRSMSTPAGIRTRKTPQSECDDFANLPTGAWSLFSCDAERGALEAHALRHVPLSKRTQATCPVHSPLRGRWRIRTPRTNACHGVRIRLGTIPRHLPKVLRGGRRT